MHTVNHAGFILFYFCANRRNEVGDSFESIIWDYLLIAYILIVVAVLGTMKCRS